MYILYSQLSASLPSAIRNVQHLTGVSYDKLSLWFRYYNTHGELPRPIRKIIIPHIVDTANVIKIYILESISFMEDVLKSGQLCNYPMMVNHLKSETRIHPLITADPTDETKFLCLPCTFSVDV